MQYVDLGSITANPAFKVLAMPNYDSEILKVRLLMVQINFISALKVNLASQSSST